jgi:hypothetical protein
MLQSALLSSIQKRTGGRYISVSVACNTASPI